MMDSEKWRVKIIDPDRCLFMLLLHQKCLTYDLLALWLSPDDLTSKQGKRSNLYFRLNHLRRAGYIKKQSIQDHDVYLLDKRGLEEVRRQNRHGLPLVNFTELTTINHDLTTARARHYLESHGAVKWVPERILRTLPEQLPQVPDGAFLSRGLSVFVEIELTRKSLERYRSIASIYTGPTGPKRVLYFYQDPAVVEPLIEMTQHHERIGFFPFDEKMPAPDQIVGTNRGCSIRLHQFLGLEG